MSITNYPADNTRSIQDGAGLENQIGEHFLVRDVVSVGGVSLAESGEPSNPRSAVSPEDVRKTVQLVSTELRKSLAGIGETSESSLVT